MVTVFNVPRRASTAKGTQHERLLLAIESSLQVETPRQFQTWARLRLRLALPFGVLICGVGDVTGESVHMHRFLGVDSPRACLGEIQHAGGGVLRPIMERWRLVCEPQMIEPEYTDEPVDPAWLATFRRYRLGNILAHGIPGGEKSISTFFSFSRIPGRPTLRHSRLLERLVPHMHVALIQALSVTDPASSPVDFLAHPALSKRQADILRLLIKGTTNRDIGTQLGISYYTVKNHMRRILVKLDVANRTQAAVMAAGFLEERLPQADEDRTA